MSCKYNYTLEERPQRCLECKEPMCGSRIPKETSAYIDCPYCHKPIQIKAQEVKLC